MTIYDPKVEEAQIWADLQEALPAMPLAAIQKQVTIVHAALEACKQKEAIVIATEWKEFKEIDWQAVYDRMSKPAFVFDGRMILDAAKLKQIGFTVRPPSLRDPLVPLVLMPLWPTGQDDRSRRPSLELRVYVVWFCRRTRVRDVIGNGRLLADYCTFVSSGYQS